MINTPLTADRRGAVYFGVIVTGNLPGGLESGIARIDPEGSATWVPVTAADAAITQVVTNCAFGSPRANHASEFRISR